MGSFEMCQMKYFFEYTLGMKNKTNKAAVKGTIVHRALQLLADYDIAQKNGEKSMSAHDFFPDMTFKECGDIDKITTMCFEYYSSAEPSLSFHKGDLRDCINWMYKALAYKKGSYDPRNQNIKYTEQFFDIEIKQPWAKYDYGDGISGYFSIKGTVDVIIQEDKKYFRVLDYKTGLRKNWATGKKKEYDDLCKDPQLRLYYYALKTMYPEWSFYVSIYYINDGGIFDIPFDEHDYAEAEKMLKNKFEQIKNVSVPTQVSRKQSHPICKYMCRFSEMMPDGSKTICQHYQDLVKDIGVDEVTREYGDLKKLTTYGDGGGRLSDSN